MFVDLEQLAIKRLEHLGDALRAEGRLDEARETLERLLASEPDHSKAARLVAILGGRAAAPESQRRGLDPAPFVRITEFLPWPEHERILDAILAQVDQFEPAVVEREGSVGRPAASVDREFRRSGYLPGHLEYLDHDIRRALEERLRTSLDAVLGRLGVPAFEVQALDSHALIYRDGDFFQPHRDTGFHNTRRVTFVYYLHRMPKQFTGGDLILYDTYFADGHDVGPTHFSRTAHTRIPCVANDAVFFASEYFHEVLPVSGVGDDIQRARVAINGWFHTSASDGRP